MHLIFVSMFIAMVAGAYYLRYRTAREIAGENWRSVINTFGVFFPKVQRGRYFRNLLMVWQLLWLCSIVAYMWVGMDGHEWHGMRW
jgi:hypothetical protein